MQSPVVPVASSGLTRPSPWKIRVLAVLGGTVVALFAFVLTMQHRSFGARASVSFEKKGDDFAELVAERNRMILEAADLGSLMTWRLALPERITKSLFPMRSSTQTYDEYCYYRYKSNLSFANLWPEHPKGRWYARTNSLGLREDAETPRGEVDLRVIVTGDSHTDGVCDNAESFANRLEAKLVERHPESAIDVGNAGKGGYSFYNYLGVLERFLALELVPDVFVVTVYGGNDFEETLTAWHFFAGTLRESGSEEYWKRINAGKQVNEPCMSQGMLAVEYFKTQPTELEHALSAALSLSGQIVGRARAAGVVPLFVYLPSWYELDPDRSMEEFGDVARAMGLERADFARVTELGERYLSGLRALGADVVDLRPTFRARRGELYWQQDHHINLAGHEAVAEALLEPVSKLGLDRP
ncbi:MAG: GDSL-type esterase/lipase family protein [Planctomycetes bacterium]|nr:GDSL-type esterase/lipase family protein [Planctomycetota bacterium]